MSSAALAPHTRFMPWRDRKGRLSWLKSLTLLALWLPLAWLLWRFWTGDLGAKPVTEALHFTGLWSVRLLLITLAITPLRLITGWGKILQIRRMAGVGAFAYALLHLALYALDQNGDIGRIAAEIVSRFYLTIGFVALAAMTALAATSFDRAIRQLGAARWQTLHSLIYPLTALAIFHAFLQAKINVSEPVVLAGVFLALMGVRALRRRVALTLPVLTALAIAAAAAAVLLEYAWYALATKLPAVRIAAANWDWDAQPRPAAIVLLIALALPLLKLIPQKSAARM
ncbi:MAG: sulfite oxidase heme-binding subunit YedZ [Beijerinckiaceae bacterium]